MFSHLATPVSIIKESYAGKAPGLQGSTICLRLPLSTSGRSRVYLDQGLVQGFSPGDMAVKWQQRFVGSYHLVGKATRLFHSAHFDQEIRVEQGATRTQGKSIEIPMRKPGRGQTNAEAGARHYQGTILSAGTSQRRGGSSETTLVRSSGDRPTDWFLPRANEAGAGRCHGNRACDERT